MRRRWLTLVHAVSALAALAIALPLAADYRQSYLDGIKALRRGDGEAAVRLLRAAIAERPREQARARLVGVIPEPYLPHSYLGLAYVGQGRCEPALAEWAIAAEHGALATVPALAAEIADHRRRCEEKAAATAPATALAVAPPGTMAAAPPADEENPGTGEAAGSPPGGQAKAPTSLPPAAEALPGAAAASAEAEGEPPPELVAAIQAYFDGDYAGALARLSVEAPAAPSRERFHRLLFRAASRHALYLLDGEKDERLLAAAVADLQAARRENPTFAPHPDFFSPRFAAFFRDHPP